MAKVFFIGHIQGLLERINRALSALDESAFVANKGGDLARLVQNAPEGVEYRLTDVMLSRFLEQLTRLSMLEAAALFAADPTLLLRPSHLTLLGYSRGEGEDTLFARARLGIIEPLEFEDNAEFAVIADAKVQTLLARFATALRDQRFRSAIVKRILEGE